MKENNKMILLRLARLVFVCLLINYNICHSAWTLIRDSDDWKVYSSDSVNVDVESYVLRTIDEIKYHETGKDYRCFPKIEYRYEFSDLWNISIYKLFTCEAVLNYDNNYDWVIFNKEDSSMYHFGGNLRSFNGVFSNYLKNNYDNKNIIKLLWLYLNTLENEQNAYYIINDTSDFEKLYQIFERPDREVKKGEDTAIVNKVIEPIRIQNLEYEKFGIKLNKICLYTWKWPSGSIEEWHFVISKDRITIDNVKELAKHLGPWYSD